MLKAFEFNTGTAKVECLDCHHIDKPKRIRMYKIWPGIVLGVIFLPLAMIYGLMLLLTQTYGCKACGSKNLRLAPITEFSVQKADGKAHNKEMPNGKDTVYSSRDKLLDAMFLNELDNIDWSLSEQTKEECLFGLTALSFIKIRKAAFEKKRENYGAGSMGSSA